MNERARTVITVLFIGGLILHIVFHRLFGLDFRAPRFATITVIVIALRWGSVLGAFMGGLAGFILALASGEPAFAATAAMAGAGWLAGEIPSRFVVETYRAIAVTTIVAALFELIVVFTLRGLLPPGGLRPAVWTMGWAVAFGPLFYWLAERAMTAQRRAPRLPSEPE